MEVRGDVVLHRGSLSTPEVLHHMAFELLRTVDPLVGHEGVDRTVGLGDLRAANQTLTLQVLQRLFDFRWLKPGAFIYVLRAFEEGLDIGAASVPRPTVPLSVKIV
jgi:hypothetical protein